MDTITPGSVEKVAIITGSSRGIGKATAYELVKNGISVVINGRDEIRLKRTEEELKEIGGRVLAVCSDVSSPGQARKLVEKTIETFGRLDILINNAAVSMRGNFSELDPSVFKNVLETNVLGCVNTSIPALPHIRQTRGSIVFISSLAGIRGLPVQSAYCSSKMALRAIAESIRVEEKKSNIHVGIIYVGITESEHDKKVFAADGSMITLKERSIFKVHTTQRVASEIMKNIKKRRFRTILSTIGRTLAILQPIMPRLIDRLLVYSVEKNLRLPR